MSCEHCGKATPIMMAMSGSPPWELCTACWIDGLRSMKVGSNLLEVTAVDVEDEDRSHAKQEVADFGKPKRARR